MNHRLSSIVIAMVAIAFVSAEDANSFAAGNYTLTVRQSDGVCADTYPADSTCSIAIETDRVLINGARAHAVHGREGFLESEADELTETHGQHTGRTVRESISINVENGTPVGGTLLYSVAQESGKTSAGQCHFSLTCDTPATP